MPDIDTTIHQRFSDQGVLVYGLHQGEGGQALADFVSQTGVSFPILEDQTATLGRLAFPQGVGYPYPRDVVIDKQLRVRAIRNSFNAAEMKQLVEQLLLEP